MPGALTMPSYYNWNYTMPSLGPNGELIGGPDPYADQADPSKGTDIRWSDDSWQHLDPHLDRNGNYDNPTIFMSNSLPGGHAAAFPDTDEYGHIGRVFRTDRNRAIGKMLALVGGGALAAGAGGAGGVGGGLDSGYGISSDFLNTGTAGLEGAGAAVPLGADVMTVTAPALGGLSAAEGVGLAGAGAGALSSGFAGSTGGGEGLSALPGDVGMEGANAANPGFFSKLGTMGKNYIHNPDGSLNMGNTLSLISSGLGALGSMGGSGTQASAQLPAGWNDPLPQQHMTRQRTAPMAQSDYETYGQNGGEHKFFTDASFSPGPAPAVAPLSTPMETPPTRYINGPGDLSMQPIARAAHGGMPAVKGPGSGRDDRIEALLSDGEYVMDAETVAMLGDGSLDEGARRLDQLRQNVRKHKGAALAKGEFSPNAKAPEQYLAKAKGGVINLKTQATRRVLDALRRGDPSAISNTDPRHLDPDMIREAYGSKGDSVLKVIEEYIRRGYHGETPPEDVDALFKEHGLAKGGMIKPRFTAEELKEQVRKLAEQYMKNRPTPVAPEDAKDQLRQIARDYLSRPPEERAKGGRIRGDWVERVIQGGGGRLPIEDRLRQLEEALKTESILRQQPTNPALNPGSEPMAPVSPEIEAARQRVAVIREAMKTPPPVKKAEGGAVKELDTFADTLEKVLGLGDRSKPASLNLTMALPTAPLTVQ